MNKKIGELVREYREKEGVSSTFLAKGLGISQGTISNIENGKFTNRRNTLKTIVEIFDVLSIPMDEEIAEFLKDGTDNLISTSTISKNSITDKGLISKEELLINSFSNTTLTKITFETFIDDEFLADVKSELELNRLKTIHTLETQVIHESIKDYLSTEKLAEMVKQNVRESLDKIFKEITGDKS